MRLFLGLLLFNMIFRSFMALTPYREWCAELEMESMPLGLPGIEERERLAREGGQTGRDVLSERIGKSFQSVGEYWKPWPTSQTRAKMNGLDDVGKFSLAWLATRGDFLGSLIHVRPKWMMFSPNAGKYDEVVRARLVYSDGSQDTVRTIAEPADILHHDSLRFLTEKQLQYSTRLYDDDEARRGWCNLLAHRHSHNEAGSSLKTIVLVVVRYDYPPPGTDVRVALAQLIVPLGQEKNPPFYEYDVGSRTGRKLKQASRN
jgi:hypothetical protein